MFYMTSPIAMSEQSLIMAVQPEGHTTAHLRSVVAVPLGRRTEFRQDDFTHGPVVLLATSRTVMRTRIQDSDDPTMIHDTPPLQYPRASL